MSHSSRPIGSRSHRAAGSRRAFLGAFGFALSATLPLACNQPEPQNTQTPQPTVENATPDTVHDQVIAVIEQYYVDLSSRDWNRYRDYFWPGATVTTIAQPPGEPGRRVVTAPIDDFIRQAQSALGSRAIFEESFVSADIRGTDTLAQVWAKYHARYGDPGDVQEWDGVDAFTLLRHEGRWRVAALAFPGDGPGPR